MTQPALSHLPQESDIPVMAIVIPNLAGRVRNAAFFRILNFSSPYALQCSRQTRNLPDFGLPVVLFHRGQRSVRVCVACPPPKKKETSICSIDSWRVWIMALVLKQKFHRGGGGLSSLICNAKIVCQKRPGFMIMRSRSIDTHTHTHTHTHWSNTPAGCACEE